MSHKSRKRATLGDIARYLTKAESPTIKPHIERLYSENFYRLRTAGDIKHIKVNGDIYKGVIDRNGDTIIVARINEEVFSFPVVICDSNADQKIREAYAMLDQQQLESVVSKH